MHVFYKNCLRFSVQRTWSPCLDCGNYIVCKNERTICNVAGLPVLCEMQFSLLLLASFASVWAITVWKQLELWALRHPHMYGRRLSWSWFFGSHTNLHVEPCSTCTQCSRRDWVALGSSWLATRLRMSCSTADTVLGWTESSWFGWAMDHFPV